jgi:acyl-CoA synthetase (AMP-forming)/AMP-acid ligase II
LHTSVLRQLLDQLPPDAFFPKLRYVRPSDRLYYREVQRLRRHVPAETAIFHGLASSEAGNVTLFKIDQELGADDEIVPMGFPVPGVELSLIDENGQEVPPGKSGEIVISGYSVALGYWCRPQLTAEKFIVDPSDPRKRTVKMGDLGRMNAAGNLVLAGRRDQMVKILGHRVEIGAVEASLESLAGVSRAAVIAHEDQFNDQILVAYVQAEGTLLTNPTLIRRQLQELLPAHMIPSRILLLDKLPLLPNGKVNRRALPSPGTARPLLDLPFTEPRTPVETVLADIWSDVLGYDQVGIYDNFLDLGGNSLQAARIIGRVLGSYQVDLTLRALFDSPTVASMALAITQKQAQQLEPHKLERLLEELDAMSNAD